MSKDQKYYIFGLGNIGREYDDTRHNTGFAVLDYLREYPFHIPLSSINPINKLSNKIYTIDSRLILCYPQTYMNNSGQAVQAIKHWYKLKDNSQIIIVYDDISLPLGKIRWVERGGAGGHHGIESIIKNLNTQDIIRLKVGIGPDPGGDRRADYVLSRFYNEEKQLLDNIFISIKDSIYKLVYEQYTLSQVMNQYNT